MAIYHLNMVIHNRAAGHSAVAGAAYRTGEKLVDERTGEMHDYTKKRGIEYKEIIAPNSVEKPDREIFWNKVEAKNKRSDAQVARDIKIAIPSELNKEEKIAVIKEFSQHIADKYSIAVDVAIHAPHRRGDSRNYHAHLLFSTNTLELVKNGEIILGNKVREFDNIAVKKSNGKLQHALEYSREKWSEICNQHLELSKKNVRIDHRTYKKQGIDKIPTIHVGAAATALERRGVETERGNMNREILENFIELENVKEALLEVTKELVSVKREAEALRPVPQGREPKRPAHVRQSRIATLAAQIKAREEATRQAAERQAALDAAKAQEAARQTAKRQTTVENIRRQIERDPWPKVLELEARMKKAAEQANSLAYLETWRPLFEARLEKERAAQAQEIAKKRAEKPLEAPKESKTGVKPTEQPKVPEKPKKRDDRER
jgi:ATP-dependent exoDNAse (exonuclease V) alpha subunit